MSIVKATLACARYAIGLVLLLGAATVLNIGIVLGWNYVSPETFSRSLTTAVNSVDAAGGDVLWQVSSQKGL